MSETVEAVDTADRVKPWTVKGIAPEERNAAIAAADREGLIIGEWLTRAIRTQVQADRQSDRLPVTLDPPTPKADTRVDRQADLADLERMVELAKTLAAANGQSIPIGITRATYSLMREHLKALKVSRTSAGGSLTGGVSWSDRGTGGALKGTECPELRLFQASCVLGSYFRFLRGKLKIKLCTHARKSENNSVQFTVNGMVCTPWDVTISIFKD